MTNWMEIDFTEAIEKISTNEKKLKQKDYLSEGNFPVIDQGQAFIGGYTNDASRLIKGQGSVIVFGDHTRIVKLVPFDFVPGADGVKVIKPRAFYNPRLFSFFMSVLAQMIPNKGYARHFQHLEATKIPFPSYNEQEHIVEKIEEMFSDLDNAIENLKKAQEQLKVYRQAVLKYAFDGKLTQCGTDFKSIKLGLACEIIQNVNKSVNPAQQFLYLDIGCIDNKTNRVVSHKTYLWKDAPSRAKQIINSGDILFSTVRTYLRNVAIVPPGYDGQIGSTGFCVIRPKKDILNSKYAFRYVLWDKFINIISAYQTGTSYPAVRDEDVFSQEIPLPELSVQQRIVDEVESRFSVCDKLEETIENGLKQAGSLRQSILKQAFEGKLTEQWRKDHKDLISGENSSEALLKKIKAEREALQVKAKGRKKHD